MWWNIVPEPSSMLIFDTPCQGSCMTKRSILDILYALNQSWMALIVYSVVFVENAHWRKSGINCIRTHPPGWEISANASECLSGIFLVKSTDSGSKMPGIESWFHHLGTVSFWRHYSDFCASMSFLICKIGVNNSAYQLGCFPDLMSQCMESWKAGPTSSEPLINVN